MSFSLIISIYNTYYLYVLWIENTLLTRKKFVNDEDDDDDDKASCIKEALEKFSAIWRPEAEAIRLIAFHGLDLREFNHSIYSKFKIIKMVVLHKLFYRNAIFIAKREDMSYVDALSYEKFVDGCIKSIGCIFLCSLTIAFCIFTY